MAGTIKILPATSRKANIVRRTIMTQEQYAQIIKCIEFGMPAVGKELTEAFNSTVELANQKILDMKAQETKDTTKTAKGGK